MPDKNHTIYIKKWAAEMGFDYCGIAKAEPLHEDARRLEQWLKKGFHGKMQFMENHFDLRTNPALLVPDAKSVITLMINYYPTRQQNQDSPKISKYAYGKDYHEVIRQKLKQLLLRMQESIGEINGRGFVDSAPVLERTWAVKSGLGWIGRNGNLLTKQSGSFFFIATLIVDLPLEYDDPFAKDYCGNCNKCVESCPTQAILPDKTIDGSSCIAYFTIELKDALLPENMKDKFNNWMFGCDVCQDICPWNRFSKPTSEKEWEPIPEILNFSTREWEALSEINFKTIFKNSPLKRTKWKGIQRNLKFLQNSSIITYK